MMLKIILLAFVVGTALTESDEDITDSISPTVTISQGTLRGIKQKTLFGRNIFSFKGIPYVQAPVGELRFKPPQPPKNWSGVYDATQDKAACPQPLFKFDEDCLHIYVHTPKLPKRGKNPKLPVILYVHPGSATTLGGTSSFVGPQYLLDRNVVLVSFNYRLAALGFLSTGDELAPGNNGLKDQVFAMRWVKTNIAAFGGDPDCVTLAGYSVGGLTVSIHMTSPMAKGLFNRVMIMSGSTAGNMIPKTHQFDLAQKQATIVGCPNDTSANIINCLKNVSAADLGNSLEQFRVFGSDPQFIWQPVIEPDYGQERYMVENPLVSIQCGRIVDVPVMTGITFDELIFLAYPVVSNDTMLEGYNKEFDQIAPYAFYYEPGTPASDNITKGIKTFYFDDQPISNNSLVSLGEVYSDSLSGFAVNRGAQLLSEKLRNKVYYYIFTYKGRYSNFNPPEGNTKYVVHFDDLLYVFWNSLMFPMFNKTDREVGTIIKMTTLYSNFARYGNPTPRTSPHLDGVLWRDFTTQNKRYLQIGRHLRMKNNIFPHRYATWRKLVPLPSTECSAA